MQLIRSKLKTLTGTRKMAGGGRLPYIDPKKFTYNDPTFDGSPPPRDVDWNVATNRVPLNPVASIDPNRVAGINPNGVSAPAMPPGPSMLSKAAGYAKDLAPFASNIVNAFRTVPKPPVPIDDSAPVLQKVNMDAERNVVSREVNASSAAADRAVDGNTAESIRQANLGTKLNQFSQISAQERNANTQIDNQQAMMNAQTTMGNNLKRAQYNSDIKEGQIAQQREQSANMANAADKYVAIGNEKMKAKVDMDKANLLKSLYSQSGVLRRQGAMWKKAGQPDPFGQDYKWLDEAYAGLPSPSGSLKRFGGAIKL